MPPIDPRLQQLLDVATRTLWDRFGWFVADREAA